MEITAIEPHSYVMADKLLELFQSGKADKLTVQIMVRQDLYELENQAEDDIDEAIEEAVDKVKTQVALVVENFETLFEATRLKRVSIKELVEKLEEINN